MRRYTLRLVIMVPVVSLAIDTARTEAQAPTRGQVEEKFYKPEDRLAAIRMGSLFEPANIAETDILKGPPQKKAQFELHFNDKVTCEFAKPGSKKSGSTPKFDCRITRVQSDNGQVQVLTPEMDEEPVKVKFGPENREIYAEVASTRLLWVLGFFADVMLPVRLECLNCPEDPHTGQGTPATRFLNEAVIERRLPGRRMEEVGKEDQGWTWKEFETISQPLYIKDGLKLLVAFIMHGDNKAAQQRMVCQGVKVNQDTNPFTTTCGESRLYVQDVGATFGGAGGTTNRVSAKMNLKEWSAKKVWKKVGARPGAVDCQAELPKSWAADDGLEHPMISEDGRRFAAGLLCQLSDSQLESLFRASRVAELPENRRAGLNEATVIQEWVNVFKRKREEIAAARCLWKAQPADLKEIDNPASLTAVQNFCSASAF